MSLNFEDGKFVYTVHSIQSSHVNSEVVKQNNIPVANMEQLSEMQNTLNSISDDIAKIKTLLFSLTKIQI